ncbi:MULTISPECIES: hypothetical protein [unclassified Streptomyces]
MTAGTGSGTCVRELARSGYRSRLALGDEVAGQVFTTGLRTR